MPFDYAGAKAAGATDEEIRQHLNNIYGDKFDVEGALSAGATLEEISQHVGKRESTAAAEPTPPEPSPAPPSKPSRSLDMIDFVSDAAQNVSTGLKNRFERIGEPTQAAKALGLPEGSMAADYVGIPERLGREVGLVGGFAGDVLGGALSVGKRELGRVTEPIFGGTNRIIDPLAEGVGRAVSSGVQAYENAFNMGDAEKANFESAIDAVNLLGLKIPSSKIVKSAGQAVEGAGKSELIAEMKPRDATASLAGKTVEEGAQKLADDISKYNLESPTLGFRGIIKKADSRIAQELEAADRMVDDAVKKDPGKQIDIDEVFLKQIDAIEQGDVKSILLPSEQETAAAILDDIYSGLEKKGLTGMQTVDKLPEIKKAIKEGMTIFKKGKYGIEDAPLKQFVGDLAYLDMKKTLDEAVPGIAEHNRAVHDLIIVKKAAGQAVKRIGNKNKVELQDWMILIGGPTAAHTFGESAAAAGIIPGSIIIGKKMLGSGRGASAVTSLGKSVASTEIPDATAVAVANAAKEKNKDSLSESGIEEKADKRTAYEKAAEFIREKKTTEENMKEHFKEFFSKVKGTVPRNKAYKDFERAFEDIGDENE